MKNKNRKISKTTEDGKPARTDKHNFRKAKAGNYSPNSQNRSQKLSKRDRVYQENYALENEDTGQREDRLEGRHPISEALKTNRTIDKLWVLEGLTERDQVIRRLVNDCRENGTLIFTVNKAQLDRISVTNAHQGLIAQVAMQEYLSLDELIEKSYAEKKDPVFIMVDEIKDAYNLGSIFRIAEASQIAGIIMPQRRQVTLDAVVAKASAGAISHVPATKVNNLAQTIDYLKEQGFWIASTRMDGENIFTSTQTNGPLVLVVGNEGKGVSPLISAKCDFHLTIPMLGQLNSLNAAVATGIIVFEIMRKRRY